MVDKTINLLDKKFTIFIEKKTIENRIHELANQLSDDYKSKNPIFVVVLTGGFIFASDLLKSLDFISEVYFIKVSSYAGLASTGKLNFELEIPKDKIVGRDIIVLEDIIETGLTISGVSQSLKTNGAKSVEIVSLLTKPSCFKCDLTVKYVGFAISDLFVVGYGLDYNQYGRQLNDIYQIVDAS
ncbi:MAG: hypoxanthine phosphoribosyltransferase [Bacteroidetes bacterium]|nr:hypoxanthine phosphoribosyltransferase [Bacteroidota bacterium]